MRRLCVPAILVALLAATVSEAWAGGGVKIKREYRTPFGKVKIKERIYPAPWFAACRPYPISAFHPSHVPAPPPQPYGGPCVRPVYGAAWPCCGKYEMKIGR